MKILVTGGAGYVGSVLIPELLEKGYYVRCLDNLMYDTSTLLMSAGNENFEFMKGDIRDQTLVKKAVSDVDYIIHLSAIVGFPACRKDPKYAREVNYYGTVNVEMFRNFQHQKMIFASTGSVYGKIHKRLGEDTTGVCAEDRLPKPLTLYGQTKLEAERAVMSNDNSVAYRFATGFGLSNRLRLDLMPNDFTYQAINNGILILYEREFRRTFIHVKDMVRSYIFAIENFDKIKGEVYNVGNEKMNCTKEDIANIIKKFVDYDIIISDKGTDPDKRNYEVSYEKIRKKGFTTKTSMEEGIKELVKGFQMLEVKKPFSNV